MKITQAAAKGKKQTAYSGDLLDEITLDLFPGFGWTPVRKLTLRPEKQNDESPHKIFMACCQNPIHV